MLIAKLMNFARTNGHLTKQAEKKISPPTLCLYFFSLKPPFSFFFLLCLMFVSASVCLLFIIISTLSKISFFFFAPSLYASSILIFALIDLLITGQICFFLSPGTVYLSKYSVIPQSLSAPGKPISKYTLSFALFAKMLYIYV